MAKVVRYSWPEGTAVLREGANGTGRAFETDGEVGRGKGVKCQKAKQYISRGGICGEDTRI